MIITGPIESFFKNPKAEPSPEGDGILYHLRRDLEKLYGDESDNNGDASMHTMLAIIGMLAGIDYLSKTYSSAEGSRKRFVETVENLCNMSNDDSEASYLFRCALVHSVGLSTVSNRYRKGTKFNFEVTDDKPVPLIQKLADASSEVTCRISYWELKRAFLKVISEIENIARELGHPKNSHVINKIGHMHSEKLLKR
ncbi:MAG: hypothetical protein AABZ10_04125 [Nitrospirota bacterium]|mgnify:CR=1 FL=1